MKKYFFFVIFILPVTICFAQQKARTQLSGKIIEDKTGLPLAGASVVLADSRTGTISDSTGYYSFKNIPTGHAIIEVSFSGYKTLVAHLDLMNNDVHNFELTLSMLENEGVTITAVANATSIRKAPIPITRVNKLELLAAPATNIIDALSRQPGISQIGSGPAISKPVIRGLGYNRLIVINDGIRQEGQQWGDEHGIEIDENSVSRVEIVKGPASLIYGSDAIAGVINIITTNPLPVNTLKANILTSFQTNNKQRSLFGNIGGNENGWNWNLWGDYKAAADYRNVYDGRVFNSKFKEGNYGGYGGFNGTWGFSHLIISKFNQTVGIIEGERNSDGAFTRILPGGATTTASDMDFNSIHPRVPYQQIRHFKVISDNSFKAGKGRVSVNLGWQRNQRKEFGDPDAPDSFGLFFDLNTFNYKSIFHFIEKNGWTSSIGMNGMFQQNQNRGQEALIPEYNLFDIGSFIYSQKTLGKTTISGGIRYDYRGLDSKELKEGTEMRFTGFKRNFYNFSTSGGASFSATRNFVLKFNLASGFRAPSIPELASNGSHEGTNRYEYGDKRLKSERSYQFDFGSEINSEHLLVTANVFYNSISNFIFYSKLRGVNTADSLVDVDGELIPAFQFNQQDAHLAGAEFLVDLHPHPLDWLHWQNTVSIVGGRFQTAIENVKNIPSIPATRWISELRGEFLKKGKIFNSLVMLVEADHSFRQQHAFTAFDTETITPAYTLLHAGISGNVMYHKRILFSLYFNAQNITDVAYQNHLSRLKYTAINTVSGRRGVFNMGRNFSIKLNIPISF